MKWLLAGATGQTAHALCMAMAQAGRGPRCWFGASTRACPAASGWFAFGTAIFDRINLHWFRGLLGALENSFTRCLNHLMDWNLLKLPASVTGRFPVLHAPPWPMPLFVHGTKPALFS